MFGHGFVVWCESENFSSSTAGLYDFSLFSGKEKTKNVFVCAKNAQLVTTLFDVYFCK